LVLGRSCSCSNEFGLEFILQRAPSVELLREKHSVWNDGTVDEERRLSVNESTLEELQTRSISDRECRAPTKKRISNMKTVQTCVQMRKKIRQALTHASSAFEDSFHKFEMASSDCCGLSGSTAAGAAIRSKALVENLTKKWHQLKIKGALDMVKMKRTCALE